MTSQGKKEQPPVPEGSTVFISKYALTRGVLEAVVEDEYKSCIKTKGYCSAFFMGDDAHTTLEEATKKAVEMADRKLASLEKQRLKIVGLKEVWTALLAE